MKNYTPEIRQALKYGKPIVTLIELELAEGNFYFTLANVDVLFNGIEYISNGITLSIDSIKQQQELRVLKLRIEFTAVEQSLLAIFLNNNNTNRRVKLLSLIVEDDLTPIGLLHESLYLIDNPSFNEGEGKSIVGIVVTNFISDFEAVRGIHTTQSSFRRFYPQSTAFINSKDAGAPLKWGGK